MSGSGSTGLRADVGRRELAGLIGAKTVSNIGGRWVPFFLPTLTKAFGATTGQMTAALGFAEMSGLAALFVGRQLDRGRERLTIVIALGLTAVGAVISLGGRFPFFAAGYLLTILGVSLCTVSGHTYLSRRVAFARRARAIGLFETSWALSLLLGAPLVALLLALFGWRGPFVWVALAAVAMMFVVTRLRPAGSAPIGQPDGVTGSPLAADGPGAAGPSIVVAAVEAWPAIAASAAIAMTGLTTIVIAGTWLSDSLGVSTGGIGGVAMAFGAAELVASSMSAAVADRVGPMRSTRWALVVALIGLVVMTQAAGSLLIGAIGLLLFFLGFEFGIVTSFTIVSEAVPAARGQVLAANTAVGTVVRGVGVVSSGPLYEAFGIAGPAGLSFGSGLVAIAALSMVGRSAD